MMGALTDVFPSLFSSISFLTLFEISKSAIVSYREEGIEIPARGEKHIEENKKSKDVCQCYHPPGVLNKYWLLSKTSHDSVRSISAFAQL